jgi:hypothetical protein
LVAIYVLLFLFSQNNTFVTNSATTEVREKISADLKSIEFKKIFDVRLTKCKDSKIFLDKISLRFLVATRLFPGVKHPHYVSCLKRFIVSKPVLVPTIYQVTGEPILKRYFEVSSCKLDHFKEVNIFFNVLKTVQL